MIPFRDTLALNVDTSCIFLRELLLFPELAVMIPFRDTLAPNVNASCIFWRELLLGFWGHGYFGKAGHPEAQLR
jgi:hypothetical protein